jgi:hypothetical protein
MAQTTGFPGANRCLAATIVFCRPRRLPPIMGTQQQVDVDGKNK